MVAENGRDALELIKAHQFDLVILDILMPVMDGYEVCRRLKRDPATAGIPILFLTALTEIESTTKGFEIGAVDYITKPISLPIVRARVMTHIRLKRALEAQEKQNEILRENIRLREDAERITQHDLKTPLSTVISIPSLLMKEGNLNDDQVEMLQMVERSGYRMLELVDSSLDLYKMEVKKYIPQHVPVDLIKILNQIYGELQDPIARKRLSLLTLVRGKPLQARDSFVLEGEEMLYYSMLSNIIKNAAEASPEGKEVTIRLGESTDAPIAVHNWGTIPEEIRSTFFDKYATWGKEGGTGLGTYSAKLIAETLGGSISFESAPESGTTIRIEIQVKQRESGAAPQPHRSEVGRTRLTKAANILIAEDYQVMRSTIKGILRQMGFSSFEEAMDGTSALALLKKAPIDIIISDWNMPNMTGIELLEFVRSTESIKNTPFLLITANNQRDMILEALEKKASDYLIKPFSPDLLKKKISRFVEM